MSSPNETTPAAPSRRWPLQAELILSHVALVCLAMLAFGTLLFAMSWHATYRRAEADLLAAAQMIVREIGGGAAPSRIVIADLYRHRFGMAPRDHAYVQLWDAAGTTLTATGSPPAHVRPAEAAPPTTGPHPFVARATGRYLDVIVATPQGGQLLIGRPLAKEWDGLEWLVGRILGLGLACVAAGAVAAWGLARRLTRPIARLAETAERIDSRRLHERIDVAAGPREVSRLGTVFNRMLAGLEDAFERQTRFVADASHELRTPVAVVLSQADHSLSRDRSPAEYREALETCRRSARRMRRLVDDLLQLARADAGQLQLRSDPLDLADLTGRTVELLRPLADDAGITLETELGAAPMSGDADRLAQVVTNLVTNAVQFSHAGGRVLVRTSREGGDAVLLVRDAGIGIPLAEQPRLFDRFYRADAARTHRSDAGTGLGLSLVREIVTAHGGTITVESAPDAGTTMTVRLPVSAPPGR